MSFLPSLKLKQATGMALLGLAAGLFQIIFLREFLVIAQGNELSLGLGLGVWLFWTSLGSLCLARARALFLLQKHVVLFLLTAGGAGVFSFALIRWLGGCFSLAGQVALNMAQLGVISFLSLALVGFFCGGGFVALLSSENSSSENPLKQATVISRLYGLEALGAALAGLLFTFVLVHFLPPAAQVLLACLALFLSALARTKARSRAACLAFCGLAGLGLVHAQELASLLPGGSFARGEVVAERESPYARLKAVRDSGQVNFFAANAWLFSFPDDYQEQSAALLGVLANPKAGKALFIGPNAEILAARALEHSNLSQAVALSMDPWLGEITAGLLKQDSEKIKRVFGDPGRYLRVHKGGFDLIVLATGPPTSFQSNRLYTEHGFKVLAGALSKKGVLVTSLPGVEHLLGVLQAKRLAGVLEAAKRSFRGIQFFSGPELGLVMTRRDAPDLKDPELWLKRYEKMAWQGVYAWQPARIRQELAPEKQQFIKDRLNRIKPVIPNRDLRPRALLFDPALWGAQLGHASAWALALAGIEPWHVVGIMLLLNLFAWGVGLFPALKQKICHRPEVAGIWVVGFSAMAMNVFLIMSYQALIGAVYLGLALLTTAFMLGTCLVCFWVTPLLFSRKEPGFWLRFSHLGLIFTCFLLWLVCGLAEEWQSELGLKAFLWAVAVLTGGFTGAYFGLAGKVELFSGNDPSLTGGRLYGWDLAGALAGALTPLVLTPTVGLFTGLIVLGLLNSMALGLFGRKAS